MPASNISWGLDIGSAGVTAIKLMRDGDQIKVADFLVLPHKKVLSTPDVDPDDVVRITLGRLTADFADDFRNANVVASVAGSDGFARFAKLPPVEPKKVNDIVKFEAVQQIPFPIEEVEWDYQLFTSPDTPEVEVGIFAMTKDKVAEKLALWGSTNLTPDELTISPLAAYNAIAYDLDFTAETPGTIILDIGTTSSDLIIAESARVWVRTFPLGGHAFTEAIQDAFKIDYAKAEKLKAEAEQSKHKKHIFQALKPVLGDLVQDVQRSITYYQDTHPDAKIDRLIGVGSTFKLFGLRKLLSQQVGMDVYRFERFKKLNVDGPAAADFEAKAINMVTAYGLALQGLGEAPLSANLVPTGVTRDAVWSRKGGPLLAAAGLGLLASGLFFLRPFLDQQDLPGDVGNLPAVQSVTREGSSLVSDKETIDEETELAFEPAIIEHLLSRRELIQAINRDVNAIIDDSQSKVEDVNDAWRVFSMNMEYFAPGATVTVEPSSGADGRGGGRGARRSSQQAPETASEFGAVAIVLDLDTQNERQLNFLNQSVLPWLQDNADRSDAYYTITSIPNIDDIVRYEVRPAAGEDPADPDTDDRDDRDDRDDGDRGGGGGFGGGGGGGGFGGGGAGGGGRGGGDSGRPPRPERSGDLDSLAPLPEPEQWSDPDRAINRASITFVLQLKDLTVDPSSVAVTGDADSTDQEES